MMGRHSVTGGRKADVWSDVERLIHEAMQLPPGERPAFAGKIGDTEIREEVLSLLAAGEEDTRSLYGVIAEAARIITKEPFTGRHFSHFQVIREIGRGGMGEVYLARDLKLGREVALKLLPLAFQRDPERLRLFEQEARAAAILNHPNIMAVYEAAEFEGQPFIAAEYVEGKTLAERLRRGPLPLEDAKRLGARIADAVAAAHERGIVHRDLKPANIKVKSDGTVKVLDFGLAALARRLPPKANPETPRENLNDSALSTESLIAPGPIIGTPAYMSPEQARGLHVDQRADIWAFGAILYEMLTGKCAFQKQTTEATLAAVLGEEPDLSKLPAGVRALVGRCLGKDIRNRWQDIGDVRIGLEDTLLEPAPQSVSSRPWIVTAAACIAALIAAFAFLRAPAKPAPQPLIRLKVDLGAEARLVNDRGKHTLAISPDGTRLAFSCEAPDGELRICTQRFDQAQATALAGTEGVEKIFFSPDGRWIGFDARGKLKKVSVQGGAPITLADAPFDRGASWGEDGFIVAALIERAGLLRIPENGGAAQPLTHLNPGENAHRWPQVLPGAQAVLFTANSQPGNYENASLDVVLVKTGQRRTLLRGGYFGRYLPSGHLVYMHQGTLFAARMDLNRLSLTGPSVPVLQDVDSRSGDGGAAFDTSRTGVFVYESDVAPSRSTVQWLEKSGNLQPLIAAPGNYNQIRLSPDGKRLAVVNDAAANPDIWIYDIERGTMTRLTFGGANEEPVWSPGSQYLIYHSGMGFGVWWIRADGAGGPRQLIKSKNIESATSLSGTHLAFEELSPAVDSDIWTAPIEGAYGDYPKVGTPELFLRTPAIEGDAIFSPDGEWLAYTSDESGANEVYVRSFRPGMPSQFGSKTQISIQGGTCPMWSRNGRELFYLSNDRRIVSVAYRIKGDSFLPDKPSLWSRFQIEAPDRTPGFTARSSVDVAPDGKRFAVLVPENTATPKPSTHVNVLMNFFDELRRRTEKN